MLCILTIFPKYLLNEWCVRLNHAILRYISFEKHWFLSLRSERSYAHWLAIGAPLADHLELIERAQSRVSEVRRGGSEAGANHPVIGNSQLNASMSNSAWKTKEGADPAWGAFQLSQIPQFASNRTSFEFPILASGLRRQHRFLLAKICSVSYWHAWKVKFGKL